MQKGLRFASFLCGWDDIVELLKCVARWNDKELSKVMVLRTHVKHSSYGRRGRKRTKVGIVRPGKTLHPLFSLTHDMCVVSVAIKVIFAAHSIPFQP
jgi:hypothetical protein